MDRAKYIDYFTNYKINKLKKLPKLSIKQIDNWFLKYEGEVDCDNCYYRINFYGYYGYYKRLDSFKPKVLMRFDILNTAICFNKLKLLKYLENRNIGFIYYQYKYRYNKALFHGAMKIIKYYDGTKINIFMTDHCNNNCYTIYICRYKYSYNNIFKVIKYLYSRGVNIHNVNHVGNNVFLKLLDEPYIKPSIYKFLKSKGVNIYKKNVWGHNALQIIKSKYKQSRDYLKRLYLINRFQNKVFYFYFAQGPKID
jgi:hypothetical protein